MGNFTRDPAATLQDALQKGYHRLRFQQGKPILDRELNLLGDLATPERIAEHHIGNGVPADSDGFRIGALNVVANDFTIGAGRCLVGGQEVVLATDTTYQGQPVTTNVAPLPAGSSNVYLRVFRSEVNGAQDADLQNGGTGNVGFETAVRERVQWEVLVTGAVIATSDHLLLATITLPAGTVADRRRANLTLAPLRDEIVLARGTTAQLSDRLAASLQDDGVLKPNSVGTSQIAANAVTAAGLQSDPVNATQRAVGKNHVQNGAVSISQLTSTLVLDAPQVSVPAAPAVGQVAEQVVVLQIADEHAFYLISVQYVGPRPAVPFFNSSFNWTRRTTLLKFFQFPAIFHRHELVIQNPNTAAITVACKAYRVTEN